MYRLFTVVWCHLQVPSSFEVRFLPQKKEYLQFFLRPLLITSKSSLKTHLQVGRSDNPCHAWLACQKESSLASAWKSPKNKAVMMLSSVRPLSLCFRLVVQTGANIVWQFLTLWLSNNLYYILLELLYCSLHVKPDINVQFNNNIV